MALQSLADYSCRLDSLETTHQRLSETVATLQAENRALKHQNAILDMAQVSKTESTHLSRQLTERTTELECMRHELHLAKEKCRERDEKLEELQEECCASRGKLHSLHVCVMFVSSFGS
jgi:chromosome segregation ATPase